MDHREVLMEAARRPVDTAEVVLADLTTDAAHTMPGGSGNSIAWLLWHAARQMDVQTAALNGEETVWAAGHWAVRLDVDRGADDFGLGDTAAQVASLRVGDLAELQAYLRACVDAFVDYVDGLSVEDLDVVVDRSWEPPVTRGVRLVSIVDDAVVHLGQAAYARGMLDGWSLGV